MYGKKVLLPGDALPFRLGYRPKLALKTDIIAVGINHQH
jgi:hypothetical protein